MKNKMPKKLSIVAVACLATMPFFTACGGDSIGGESFVAPVLEETAHVKNSCTFKTNSYTYYKKVSVEDGIFLTREAALKGDTLVSVNTYKDAPYSFVAAECADMEGDEVKCEGDKITVIVTGDPAAMQESFKQAIATEEKLCGMFQ
jgi:hypothetical protein